MTAGGGNINGSAPERVGENGVPKVPSPVEQQPATKAWQPKSELESLAYDLGARGFCEQHGCHYSTWQEHDAALPHKDAPGVDKAPMPSGGVSEDTMPDREQQLREILEDYFWMPQDGFEKKEVDQAIKEIMELMNDR